MFKVSPVVTKDRAHSILSKPPGPLRRRRAIEVVNVVYMPGYLYAVELINKSGRLSHGYLFADSLEGYMAFTRSLEAQPNDQTVSQDLWILSADQALGIARQQYKRLLMELNLKQRENKQIQSMTLQYPILYPYWVGYFRRKGKWDFDCIDAVSGEKQGVQIKGILQKVLLLQHKSKK
jgi:hypothetical protein